MKNEGLKGKNIVLRIDIEKYEMQYEDIYDEDGKFIRRYLRMIEFFQVKETILQSMNFMFDNRAKSKILLGDFGPTTGIYNNDYSMKYFYDFLLRENIFDNAIYFIQDLDELNDFEEKLENEQFKENCLIIVENLNFFWEEIGCEIEKPVFGLENNIMNPNTNIANSTNVNINNNNNSNIHNTSNVNLSQSNHIQSTNMQRIRNL